MVYTPTTWVNGSSPFINATNLQHIEQGIVDAQALIPSAGKGGMGAVLVASNDASTLVKNAADYVCDGTNDQAEINAALIDAAQNISSGPVGADYRGAVQLTGGRFFLGGSILLQNASTLAGWGRLTELFPVSLSAVTGSGANPACIKLSTNTDHLTVVRDLRINLNAASGGSGHGINLDMTGSAATSTYPTMDPDADHLVTNVTIINGNNATRHGIWFLQDTGAHNRGSIISDCQIRTCGGNGIRVENASDMLITSVHMGGSGDYGYYISGGNTMLFGNKSYFSDVGGYFLSAGRSLVSACSSQDELTGFTINGANTTLSGCIVDTASDYAYQVNSNGVIISGCYAFVRGGGRYATMTRGLYFPAAQAGCLINMSIDPSNVTTPLSGSFTGNRGQVINADTGAVLASA